MVVNLLWFIPPLAAIAVGLLVLADARRTEAGPRGWVYWPAEPRYGRRALVPGSVIVALGAAGLVFHLVNILR